MQNICHLQLVLKGGHFVMPIQLIFDPDAKPDCKDIIFFAADTRMVLPVVHLTPDTAFMPSYSNLFKVCN